MLLDVVDQPVLIFAHPEEVILLLDELGFLLMIRAFSIYQFPLGIEAFTPEAIVPAVFPEVEVSVLMDFPEDELNYVLVFFVGGSNEVVVGDVQLGPQIPEQ